LLDCDSYAYCHISSYAKADAEVSARSATSTKPVIIAPSIANSMNHDQQSCG
jgi:hypothetical protein